MPRHVAAIILFCLQAVTPLCASADNRVDSLLRVIERGYGNSIEGVWRMTASPESVLAITAREATEGSFDIWLLDSPDYRIEPCVLIGHASEGAEAGSYDLVLSEKPGNLRGRKRSFTARFENSDTGRLRLRAYKRGKRISIWRWLPYLFRVTVVEQSDRPADHDGLVRIYPASGGRFDL